MRDPTAGIGPVLRRIDHFNPQVPCGTRRNSQSYRRCCKNFNPQVPCGTRLQHEEHYRDHQDFNPQVPCGTRPTIASYQSVLISYFNPQVPCGTRLYERIRYTPLKTFQSTGPLRDPTLRHLVAEHLSGISIHRSLAGPDRRDWMTRRGLCHFNPQVPCGTRLFLWAIVCTAVLFQSTGPLRDPTDPVLTINIIWIHFNPQVPCGTRLRPVLLVISSINFNPQVPCGTRHSKRIIFSNAENFNPQVPCGTRQTEAG